MITIQTVLVSIEGAWNKSRNTGNFISGEIGILEEQVELGNVRIVRENGSNWAQLTDSGRLFLYHLNSTNKNV